MRKNNHTKKQTKKQPKIKTKTKTKTKSKTKTKTKTKTKSKTETEIKTKNKNKTKKKNKRKQNKQKKNTPFLFLKNDFTPMRKKKSLSSNGSLQIISPSLPTSNKDSGLGLSGPQQRKFVDVRILYTFK